MSPTVTQPCREQVRRTGCAACRPDGARLASPTFQWGCRRRHHRRGRSDRLIRPSPPCTGPSGLHVRPSPRRTSPRSFLASPTKSRRARPDVRVPSGRRMGRAPPHGGIGQSCGHRLRVGPQGPVPCKAARPRGSRVARVPEGSRSTVDDLATVRPAGLVAGGLRVAGVTAVGAVRTHQAALWKPGLSGANSARGRWMVS